jgi:hypothetical protein
MKNIFSILSITSLLLITACSKEIKVKNQLTSQNGIWKVDTVKWVKVNVNSLVDVGIGTELNAGQFQFNSNGTGSFDITIDGTLEHKDFTWSTNGSDVSIADTVSNHEEVVVYSIEHNTSSKQVWFSSETIVEPGDVYNRELKISMSL